MKYESAILKRLIDIYGVVGNPRYISEIIKEFIVRGKECYPNLFTYQSDWLAHIDEFGLNPSYTVTYTGQSIYAPNTLERPVKSAILKGNTLVNHLNITYPITSWGDNPNNSYTTINLDKTNLLPNTDYLLIIECLNSVKSAIELSNIFTVYMLQFDTTKVHKVRTIENLPTSIIPHFLSASGVALTAEEKSSIKMSLIPYQDGMENWDIPYFEGMQSVKLPVLTTMGKNLFDGIIEFGGINANTGLDTTWSSNFRTSFMRVPKNNTNFLFTFNYKGLQMSGGYLVIIYYNENKERILSQSVGNQQPFNFNQDAYYYRITQNIEDNLDILDITNIQLEEGTVATSYEPFKSNILSCNEEVTLRGIGDVQDTLNCLTGEVTERIGEVVLDGSENWFFNNSVNNLAVFYTNTLKNTYKENGKINVDSLLEAPIKFQFWLNEKNIYSYYSKNGGSIFYLMLPYDVFSTISNVKKWLQENPIVVQYQLATESVKTVDLTILDQNGENVKQLMSFNGGTHFNTMSTEGSPLPSVCVSVETDLEETLKVCSLEGNTL